MSWKWIIRSRDGGMNGLEFACATTEGGTRTVLVHAAPAQATVEVRDEADAVVARGEADACGPSTPMSLVELGVGAGTRITRREVWPTEGHYGLPVILCGGEVGILRHWENGRSHDWWRWSVDFSNRV